MSARSDAQACEVWSDLLDDAGLYAAIVDARGRVHPASQSLLQPGALAREAPADIVEALHLLTDAAGVLRPELRRLLESRQGPAPIDRAWRAADGSSRHVRWYAKCLHAADGTLDGMALLGVNLSRRRAEQRRHERLTDVYRALVEVCQALLPLHETVPIYQAACRGLVEHGRAVMAGR